MPVTIVIMRAYNICPMGSVCIPSFETGGNRNMIIIAIGQNNINPTIKESKNEIVK